MNLRSEYKNRNPEGHFFDKETMRFFDSRICYASVRIKDADWYFITSEKCDFVGDPDRMYTVRKMKLDGNIETIGEFNTLTKYQAEKLLNELVPLEG